MNEHRITDIQKLLSTFDYALSKWLKALQEDRKEVSTGEVERLVKLAQVLVQELDRQRRQQADSRMERLSDEELEREIARLLAGENAAPGAAEDR